MPRLVCGITQVRPNAVHRLLLLDPFGQWEHVPDLVANPGRRTEQTCGFFEVAVHGRDLCQPKEESRHSALLSPAMSAPECIFGKNGGVLGVAPEEFQLNVLVDEIGDRHLATPGRDSTSAIKETASVVAIALGLRQNG